MNYGRCGVCGDPWDKTPRENEAGGLYASEMITGVYTTGTFAEIALDVSNANGGFFEFRLCANNDFAKPVTEECLNEGLLQLEDGTTRYTAVREGVNKVVVKLPLGLLCDQCVLQWKYNTGMTKI